MAAHQAPPSLGFSRQEHWSGLPFPSPMHESENEREVAQSCLTLATPWTAAYQTPPSMGFSRQEYRGGFPLHFSTILYKIGQCDRACVCGGEGAALLGNT